MRRLLTAAAILFAAVSCGRGPKDGIHSLKLLTTNDVHGTWFDSLYTGGETRRSLFAAAWYIDSVRTSVGKDNVLLVDAGDCLQGDNATYYFNYVDTLSPHLFPRLAAYMGYDAIAVGNHDVETGHPVYDRVAAQLAAAGIPFLGGNAVRTDNGKPYFPLYKTFRRAGLKVLVLGYTNPNIKAWLGETIWEGMDFKSLLPLVQEDVDRLTAKEKPQVVIVVMHSGTGKGDGSSLESQGLDLYQSLHGVDVLVCSHDHRPFTKERDHLILINSGSHSRNVGYGEITVETKHGKVVSKQLHAGLIPIDKDKADPVMREHFRPEFEAVRDFTVKPIGKLSSELVFKEAVKGPTPYLALIHKVCLGCEPAQISIAAPLNVRNSVAAGTLLYDDMFKIYPYENQLYIVQLTGAQIKGFLEESYDNWVYAPGEGDGHVLKIVSRGDARYGYTSWSFTGATYNFDSAAGINYTVDVTKGKGERVCISSMADGSAFDPAATYNVAMTSYRASGGGDLLSLGAGVDSSAIDSITVRKYPAIRDLIYDYVVRHGTVDTEALMADKSLGSWSFEPAAEIAGAIEQDFNLVFR